jgi:hypothetical protein
MHACAVPRNTPQEEFGAVIRTLMESRTGKRWSYVCQFIDRRRKPAEQVQALRQLVDGLMGQWHISQKEFSRRAQCDRLQDVVRVRPSPERLGLTSRAVQVGAAGMCMCSTPHPPPPPPPPRWAPPHQHVCHTTAVPSPAPFPPTHPHVCPAVPCAARARAVGPHLSQRTVAPAQRRVPYPVAHRRPRGERP